jgi:hypothetical protein
MFLVGLPTSGDLQEKFLLQRFGATSLFRGKIQTRLTQGLGRCTRDVADYALVFLVGSDLLKWIASSTNSTGLPPEIRAELEFGLDNSTDASVAKIESIAAAFLEQNDEWREAETYISSRRTQLTETPDPLSASLSQTVEAEIQYSYALWRSDFEGAYACANRVLEGLAGGDELKPYRSLWHYLAAVCAYQQYLQVRGSTWNASFKDNVARAMATTLGISWLSRLRELRQLDSVALPEENLVNPEPVSRLLGEWRLMGGQFGKSVGQVRTWLSSKEAAGYERGIQALGRMLGFESISWKEAGIPDGLWILPRSRAIVFEAKTEEGASKAIPYKDVRQALTHEAWIKERLPQYQSYTFGTLMVTDQSTVSNVAGGTLGELRIVSPALLLKLLDQVTAVLSSVRDRARALRADELSELIMHEYQQANLDSETILKKLTESRLDALPRNTE